MTSVPMSDQDVFSGPPKTMFLFGLVSGIAIAAILGLLFGFNFNAALVAGSGTQPAALDAPPAPSVPAPTAELDPVTDKDWVRGDLKKAKVVLVEYSDYECPFCERHHPTMQSLVDTYGDDVAWVYRHFPLSFHPSALPAANAAECVGNLAGNDAFWSFSDAMFANQGSLGTALYESTATSLGVDLAKFQDCVTKKTYQSEITSDQSGGQAAGVSGTPATFVNGRMVSGAVPVSQFQAIIDSLL